MESMSDDQQNIFLSNEQSRYLMLAFIVAVVLFVSGLFLPMLTITKLLMLENTISVASSVYQLLISGSWGLFLLIFGFSVVLPALKLRLIYALISANGVVNEKTQKWLRIMHDYGRWGMLDVFVVAVILVSVKLGALASVEVHSGLYLFGSAVLFMMILTHHLSTIYGNVEIVSQGQNEA
jgi:paraquat-inducible protein A